MKKIWSWIEKNILLKNNNVKCGNGLNKLFYSHKGVGDSDKIRKTFFLKDWNGPIGELKYYYESGNLKTIEIWELEYKFEKLGNKGEKVDNFKMIKHTSFNEDGSLRNGSQIEYISEFDVNGSNNITINKDKKFWSEPTYIDEVTYDDDVTKRLIKVKTLHKQGVLTDRKIIYD